MIRDSTRSLCRWIAAAGGAGLLTLGVAYVLTCEPAPRVRIQWRADVTAEQQVALERTYLLVNPRERMPGGSTAYDLLDTRVSNIRALLEDPSIANTGDIDGSTYSIPFDTEYGIAWMWVAHRIPGLRDGRVQVVVVVALSAMALGALLVGRGIRRHQSDQAH